MNCDECQHRCYLDKKLVCLKGHKPRFMMPKNELDDNFGWKRLGCKDFEQIEEDDANLALACVCGSVRFAALANGNVECHECQGIYQRKDNNWVYLG